MLKRISIINKSTILIRHFTLECFFNFGEISESKNKANASSYMSKILSVS